MDEIKYTPVEDIPADTLERLRASIAAVDVARRRHRVNCHPVSFEPYLKFEGYNIAIAFVKGVKPT